MGNPAALVAGPALSPMGIAATISRAPSDPDDTLDLHWLSPRDGQDGEEVVGERDLRWVSTARLPAVDDDALLLVDSLGDPWAFVWATGASLSASPAEATAFDARLDALEAVAPVRMGHVTAAGAVDLGSGVSATKNATGDYTLTFSPAFASNARVVAMQGKGSSLCEIKEHPSNTSSASTFQLASVNAAGSLTDSDFWYVANG